MLGTLRKFGPGFAAVPVDGAPWAFVALADVEALHPPPAAGDLVLYDVDKTAGWRAVNLRLPVES